MLKTFDFGKIDFFNCGRKINRITIEVNLKMSESDEGPVFTAICNIYNSRGIIVAFGQMFNDIDRFFKDNPLFQEIKELWSKYHLNDMHSGTPEQEDFIKKNLNEYDFDKACNLLKNANMYETKFKGRNVKYGHQWLYWEIPERDLERIKKLVS